MARPNPRLLTQDDLFHLPDDGLRYELVRGHLVSEPPPGYRHGRTAATLTFELEDYARAHGHRIAVTCDVGFCLSREPDTVRAPDVAVLQRSRLATFDDDRRYFPGAPDLAVEVLSPSDRRGAVREKVADYLDSGSVMVWLVDPARREIRVCTSAGEECIGIGGTLTANGLLPGFALPLDSVFE